MTTTATYATSSRPTATLRDHAGTDRPRRRPGAASATPTRPSDLPREYRIAYVYRTLGGGLVAEYDPD